MSNNSLTKKKQSKRQNKRKNETTSELPKAKQNKNNEEIFNLANPPVLVVRTVFNKYL